MVPAKTALPEKVHPHKVLLLSPKPPHFSRLLSSIIVRSFLSVEDKKENGSTKVWGWTSGKTFYK